LPTKKEKTIISVEVANEILDASQPITLVPNENKEYTAFASTHVKTGDELDFEQASYNFSTNQHLINKIVQNENHCYSTSIEDLNMLARGTQNNIDKVLKINSLIKYYANKNDLVGIVIGTIENNVNTNYKISYPKLPDNVKKKNKLKDKVDTILSNFIDNVDLKLQIRKEGMSTFTQGTYFTYLRSNNDGTYGISTYPLGLVDFTDYTIDGEPVIYMDMIKLRSSLATTQSKYKTIKSSFINFSDKIEDEIQKNYPPEVYDAYINNYKWAILNPQRTGIHRINELDGIYGVSPIFKALNALLMLETIDNIDRENILARSKKIFYQKTRKEILGTNGDKTKNFAELKFAQDELVKAMSQKIVIYTSPAYIEDLQIIEPKAELVSQEVIARYKNQVLNSLGISFLSNEAKSSFNTVQVSVDELLKTVNKVVYQFENTLNKYIKVICQENGIDSNYIPVINIEKSELLSDDAKLKLVEILFSKMGMSYSTIFEMLGMDYNTEVERRKAENADDIENVFSPHITSYTSSDSEKGDITGTNTIDTTTNTNGSIKNTNLDKNANDKALKDGQL
jgi:hypothetical protein